MKKLLCLGLLLCLPTFAHAEGEYSDAEAINESVSEGMPAVDPMGNPAGMNEEQAFEPKKFELTESQKALFEQRFNQNGDYMIRGERYLLPDSPSKAAWRSEDMVGWKRSLKQKNVKTDDNGDDQ